MNDSRRISGAMIVLSMLVPVANAQSIYDSGGFDNPSRFTTGTIVGQDTGVAFWGTSGENGNSATVQSDAAAVSPPRDVVVNYQNAFGALWWPETSRVTPTAAEPYVLITWDEKVPATGVGGDGPYFGVNAYAAVGTIGAANGAAHLFVDADARQVSYFSTTGLRGLAAVDTAWHHYMLALNFQTQQFSAYFDGTALLTNVAFLNGGDTFVDAAIWIPQGNPSDPSANAYFDNFTESLASSVPEPSGVVVACLAGLMLLRRRSSI